MPPFTFTRFMKQQSFFKILDLLSLRVYSTVIGNGRTLQNDAVICGYHIPKGVSLKNPYNDSITSIQLEKFIDTINQDIQTVLSSDENGCEEITLLSAFQMKRGKFQLIGKYYVQSNVSQAKSIITINIYDHLRTLQNPTKNLVLKRKFEPLCSSNLNRVGLIFFVEMFCIEFQNNFKNCSRIISLLEQYS